MSLSRTSFGVDSSGQLRIRIAGPPVPVPEFYALLDRALQCEGWNPREGVVEDIRDLTGIPPLTCMKAMADYFMTRTMPAGLSRGAVALPPDSDGLEEAIKAASIFSIGGPVEVLGFETIESAQAWAAGAKGSAAPVSVRASRFQDGAY